MHFLTSDESTLNPLTSGIRPPLGHDLAAWRSRRFLAVPIGIAAAIYLEEYATQNRLTPLHPSEHRQPGRRAVGRLRPARPDAVRALVCLGRSVLAGVRRWPCWCCRWSSSPAARLCVAVPKSIREAAYAVGATRWQTIRHHVLPAALPGIMTGIILALSRAIGETAPLIVVGAVAYITSGPQRAAGSSSPRCRSRSSTGRSWPCPSFIRLAGAASSCCWRLLLTMNAVAVGIRGMAAEAQNVVAVDTSPDAGSHARPGRRAWARPAVRAAGPRRRRPCLRERPDASTTAISPPCATSRSTSPPNR